VSGMFVCACVVKMNRQERTVRRRIGEGSLWRGSATGDEIAQVVSSPVALGERRDPLEMMVSKRRVKDELDHKG
jgi:hypothetical protein